MDNDEKLNGFMPHPDAAKAEAIAQMCAAHNISLGSVPNDIALVPTAIAAILEQRPRWGMDTSW